MTDNPFNPQGMLEFNLNEGQMRVSGGAPRLLLPADAIGRLLNESEPDKVRDMGAQIGTELGRSMTARLATLEGLTPEKVTEHLGGDLALMGLGSLSLERWGHALVVRVDGCALGASGDLLLEGVIEGAIGRSAGRNAQAVMLARSAETVRFLVTGAKGAEKAKALLSDGNSWGDVLATLQPTAA